MQSGMTRKERERTMRAIFDFMASNGKVNNGVPTWFHMIMRCNRCSIPVPGFNKHPYLWRQRMNIVTYCQDMLQQIMQEQAQKQQASNIIHAPAGAVPRSRMH